MGVELCLQPLALGELLEGVEDLGHRCARGGGSQHHEGLRRLIQLMLEEPRGAPHELTAGPRVTFRLVAEPHVELRQSLSSVRRARFGPLDVQLLDELLERVVDRIGLERERHSLRDEAERLIPILHDQITQADRAAEGLHAAFVVAGLGLPHFVDVEHLFRAVRASGHRLGLGEHLIIVWGQRAGAEQSVEGVARILCLLVQDARVTHQQPDLLLGLGVADQLFVDLRQPLPGVGEPGAALHDLEHRLVGEVEGVGPERSLEGVAGVVESLLIDRGRIQPTLFLLRGRAEGLGPSHVELGELCVTVVGRRELRQLLVGLLIDVDPRRQSVPGGIDVVELLRRDRGRPSHGLAGLLRVRVQMSHGVEGGDELSVALFGGEVVHQAALRFEVRVVGFGPRVESGDGLGPVIERAVVELRELAGDGESKAGVLHQTQLPLERVGEPGRVFFGFAQLGEQLERR